MAAGDGGKGSDRRPGAIPPGAWEAIDWSKKLKEVIPCGGCGATDPKQRCLGCRHDFGDGYDPVAV